MDIKFYLVYQVSLVNLVSLVYLVNLVYLILPLLLNCIKELNVSLSSMKDDVDMIVLLIGLFPQIKYDEVKSKSPTITSSFFLITDQFHRI